MDDYRPSIIIGFWMTLECHAPNFVEKTFANSHKTVKFAEVFSLKSFWPYSKIEIHVSHIHIWMILAMVSLVIHIWMILAIHTLYLDDFNYPYLDDFSHPYLDDFSHPYLDSWSEHKCSTLRTLAPNLDDSNK